MRARVIRFAAALQALLLMSALVLPALTSAAVRTDQADYLPGSVVTISGDNSNGVGYVAGETIHVDVFGPNAWTSNCAGVADDAGAWSCQVTLDSDPEVAVGDYSYIATGLTSGVSESGTFTDAVNVTVDGPSSFIWYTSVSSFDIPVSGTYTCNATGASCTSITGITVTVPGVAGSKLVTGLSLGSTAAVWSTTLQFRSAPGANQFAIPTGGTWNVTAVLDTNRNDTSDTENNFFGYDAISPASSIQCNSNPCAGMYSGDVTVTLDATDPGASNTFSGIASTAYCVDLVNSCTPTLAYPGGSGTSVTRVAGATKYVRYFATDVAGNVETTTSQAIAFTPDDVAPTVTGTSPTNLATGAAVGDNILVTFSESMTVDSNWIMVVCAATNITGTTTPAGAGTVFTFDPGSALPSGATCSVSVRANQVHDVDANDPPDGLAANYDFTFTTASSVTPTTTTVTCPASVTYTGSALTPCTAQVTGSGGFSQSLSVNYSNNTNVGTASASASFGGDATHSASNDSENFSIGQAASVADVTCTAGPFTYTGAAQTPCSVSVTGAGGLNLTPTPLYSNNVNAGLATSSYTFAGDANHTGSNDSENFTIAKADATCTVTPYSGTYDAAYHGIGVVCTGVDAGDAAAGGSVTNTDTFKDAPGGTASWSFSGGTNYDNQSGTGAVTIAKADAVCSFPDYSVVYDGFFHGADGSLAVLCTGVDLGGSAVGSTLILGASYKFVPGGTANWVFTGGINYNDQSGSTVITITTAFRIDGFYQPVDMSSHAGTRIYNSVKNGQTVPLKFRVFTLGGTEITSTTGLAIVVTKVNCVSGVVDPDMITTTATGGTTLRYADGFFIFNWTVPKGANICYEVTVQTVDHADQMSYLGVLVDAYFKAK